MKRALAPLLFFVILGLNACSKDNTDHGPDGGVSVGNGRNGNFLHVQADLTGAKALTATIPNNPSDDKRLIKVTASNKFEEVFGGAIKLYNFKITPTHIIAHVNIWEGDEHCSLIAIPKTQGKTRVLCLNREYVNCGNSDSAHEYTGYDVQGSTVYFTYHEDLMVSPYYKNRTPSCSNYYNKTGSYGSAKSELRVWDGESETVTTLFQTYPNENDRTQLMVRDVFASQTNKNICIDTANSDKDSIYCKVEGEANWKNIKNFSMYRNYPFLKHKNKLLSDDGYGPRKQVSLNLETMEIAPRKGDLPRFIDFQLNDGGILGRTEWRIVRVLPNGDSEELLPFETPQVPPARVGNFAWYMRGDSLRRVDLAEGNLDKTDFFSNTTLLRLSGIYWTMGDFLRTDGTGAKGTPSKSYLNSDGTLMYVEASPINVEHPIDLTWDK